MKLRHKDPLKTNKNESGMSGAQFVPIVILAIRWCGNGVRDTWEPWKLRSRNFSMTSEEFYEAKIIDITITKSSFTVFDNMIFDSD